MVTQVVHFGAAAGLSSLVAELFAYGSDSVVKSTTSIAPATNRKQTYEASFTDAPAGTYRFIARDSVGNAKAKWWVRLYLLDGDYECFEDDPTDWITHLSTFDPASQNVTISGASVIAIQNGLSTFDPTSQDVNVSAASVTAIQNGLSTFDPTSQDVNVSAASVTLIQNGLSTFDPTSQDVNVSTASVTAIQNGLSTFDPTSQDVNVSTASITAIQNGLSTFDPTSQDVNVSSASVTAIQNGLSTFDPTSQDVNVSAASVTAIQNGLSTFDPTSQDVNVSTASITLIQNGLSTFDPTSQDVNVSTASITLIQNGLSTFDPTSQDVSISTATIDSIQTGLATEEALADLASIFTGISQLKEWFAILAGAASSPAVLQEMNSTAAGATFDNADHSLQALRTRGDTDWTSTGSFSGLTISSFQLAALNQISAVMSENASKIRYRTTSSIEIVTHDQMKQLFRSLGNLSLTQRLLFMIKARFDDPDSDALVFISSDNGLETINGAAVDSSQSANGSLVIQDTESGDIEINLTSTYTGLLVPTTPEEYYYGIKAIESTGRHLRTGRVKVTAGIVQIE